MFKKIKPIKIFKKVKMSKFKEKSKKKIRFGNPLRKHLQNQPKKGLLRPKTNVFSLKLALKRP